MMYYTHLLFGLLVSLLSMRVLGIDSIFYIPLVLLFSVIPDVDERKSKIGKKSMPISALISFIFGHRGIFHSIYFPIIFFSIFYNVCRIIAVSFLVGYSSHLFLDAMTKYGIKPFYPLSNHKLSGFLKTNSLLEKVFFLIIALFDVLIILRLF